MAASGNLEGHGRPNVFLAGQVGQKYKDLDSGLEYVCTGERGFIKVDGDDQSEMYNWELVESGGSTGGGRFDINATIVDSSVCTLDKTFEEIRSAYNDGMVVNLMMTGNIFTPSAILENGINFTSVSDGERNLTILTVYVTPDNTAHYIMKNISH